MVDKTTIQLKDSTKTELEELKRADGESYDSVVKMLIAHYNNSQDGNCDGIDEAQAREIADERISERVIPEAQR